MAILTLTNPITHEIQATFDLTEASALMQQLLGTTLVDIFPQEPVTTNWNPDGTSLALVTLTALIQNIFTQPTSTPQLRLSQLSWIHEPTNVQEKLTSEVSAEEWAQITWHQSLTKNGDAWTRFSFDVPHQPAQDAASTSPESGTQNFAVSQLQVDLGRLDTFLQVARDAASTATLTIDQDQGQIQDTTTSLPEPPPVATEDAPQPTANEGQN